MEQKASISLDGVKYVVTVEVLDDGTAVTAWDSRLWDPRLVPGNTCWAQLTPDERQIQECKLTMFGMLRDLGLPQTWPWSLHLNDILEKHFIPQLQDHVTVHIQHFADRLNDIGVERAKQDIKWGGPEHDDRHSVLDWVGFIATQLEKVMKPGADFNQRMIKIAALAIAAMESRSRKNGGTNG